MKYEYNSLGLKKKKRFYNVNTFKFINITSQN